MDQDARHRDGRSGWNDLTVKGEGDVGRGAGKAVADAICKAQAFKNHGRKVRKFFECGERSWGRAGRRDGIKLRYELLMNGRVGEHVVRYES